MWKDPIVEEVHRIRRKLSAQFDHDIDAICADVREREKQLGQKVVDLSSEKARSRLGWRPGKGVADRLRETIDWYRAHLSRAREV